MNEETGGWFDGSGTGPWLPLISEKQVTAVPSLETQEVQTDDDGSWFDGATSSDWNDEDQARKQTRAWRRWSDDGDPESYPYPNKHVKSAATGELASRIRRALGCTDESAQAFIVETKQYGGYSEYTQENFKWLVVECDGQSEEFEPVGTGPSAFSLMLTWLDECAPVVKCCPGCSGH